MSLDGECETGEFHTLTEPLHDEVFGTEVAFPYKFDPTYCPYRLSELQDMNTPENIAVCHGLCRTLCNSAFFLHMMFFELIEGIIQFRLFLGQLDSSVASFSPVKSTVS